MEKLIERIRKEGRGLPGDILKVDSFLNHQVDIKLAEEIGEEYYRIFKDRPVTKILTIEVSGLIFATMTAKAFGYVPVVYAKKGMPSNMDLEVYQQEVHSFTHNGTYLATVAKQYLSKDDHVLIIDDFLANGEAMAALITICQRAGATIEGCGVVIEKSYLNGRQKVKDLGYEVYPLADIVAMENDKIEFAQ
ncbi:MAG: xanthine phosphoribosyltransferase [Solobacterium sp.]|nr:xanthine phosphoribosyltransferase [Solobacterium sp.]